MASDEHGYVGGARRTVRQRLLGIREKTLVVAVLVAGITGSELLLFFGHLWPSIWGHFLTLVACFAFLQWSDSETVVQTMALVPLFRLVNLGMPVFFQLTAYWFPLIYGPLIPALVYVDQVDTSIDVPFGWKRGLLLAPIAVVLGAGLAEFESMVLNSEALIPTWSIAQVAMITVVMICFVGFVEEHLFRGLLQGTLEQEFGRWPGLLVASALFGLMHSGYQVPAEMLVAGLIGLVYGLAYDYLDSLVFITIAHGALNVFLFAVYPIQGSFLFG